ncbi:MAG: PaaI family thioesterase [Clostridiales bacterium]|uniref:PaaI family thioesterase n=1 Tax=Roseburia sp. MSJ-14 TaxID=2841514 RepID=UPI0016A11B1E|nr:PaaI family thioesterase [Roseburia sp. MSJ-14]NLK78539.1 PaaI family thioesterase [Clostridiales bacterium]
MLLEECQELLKQNPFANLLDMELLEVSEGFVKAKIPFQDKIQNIYGDFHGGALYSAADTLCGIAASSYGYYVTTINGSIQYLKAGRNTEYVICEAKVIKPGRNISVVEFQIMDERDMLLNTGTFHFYNLKKK